MKPYSEYSAEELAMERLFIRWVRNPNDPHVRKFWVNWVKDNPQQAETVESAKMLVDTVSDWQETEMSAGEGQSLWDRIRYSILGLPEPPEPILQRFIAPEHGSFLKWSLGIGATVIVLLFLFMRDTTFYPNNQEDRNRGASVREGDLSAADSAKSYPHPDSAKVSNPRK